MRILSGTLQGKELYRIEDETGEIVVTQRGDKRVLSFDSSLEQSSLLMSKPFYLSHEYTQIMILGLIFVDAKHVTVLGLGGGGLVYCLRHFYPTLFIQAVELRQIVIDTAYEWFDLPRDAKVKVNCADANRFLDESETESTDIIFSDLYEAEGMSNIQVQEKFIKNCHRVLSNQGWMILNFHDLPEDDSELIKSIKELFWDVYVCNVFKGNWVVFCGKSPAVFEQHELKERANELVKKTGMPLMYYFKQLKLLGGPKLNS